MHPKNSVIVYASIASFSFCSSVLAQKTPSTISKDRIISTVGALSFRNLTFGEASSRYQTCPKGASFVFRPDKTVKIEEQGGSKALQPSPYFGGVMLATMLDSARLAKKKFPVTKSSTTPIVLGAPGTGLSFALSDTSGEVLKIKKRKFIFRNEPAKSIWQGFDYSPAFKSLVSSNTDAEAAFNKSRYYSYANLAGWSVMAILTLKAFLNALNQNNDLHRGRFPDNGFKASEVVPVFVTAGFCIGTGIQAKKNFKKGVKSFNSTF